MKVIEYLEKANKTLFSYEILPLKRGGRINDIFSLVDELAPFDPPFIDLTSRSAEVYYDEYNDGSLKRHIRRKRPGTIGLSAAIKIDIILRLFHTFYVMVSQKKKQKMRSLN
jgi:methylenetetrahydrofolate reductase (NADPH)